MGTALGNESSIDSTSARPYIIYISILHAGAVQDVPLLRGALAVRVRRPHTAASAKSPRAVHEPGQSPRAAVGEQARILEQPMISDTCKPYPGTDTFEAR